MTDHLEHHGVKGMKWGVRRYQKSNGKLTRRGKKRIKQYEEGRYNRDSDLATAMSNQHSSVMKKANQKVSAAQDKRDKSMSKFVSTYGRLSRDDLTSKQDKQRYDKLNNQWKQDQDAVYKTINERCKVGREAFKKLDTSQKVSVIAEADRYRRNETMVAVAAIGFVTLPITVPTAAAIYKHTKKKNK